MKHELVGDCVTGDSDTADSGVGRNRTDGDTVTTNAGVALEDNVAALVDSEAIILVVDRTGSKRKHDMYEVKGGRVYYLSSIVRSVVLQSNPSVLWPAALPSLFELGASPAATATHQACGS